MNLLVKFCQAIIALVIVSYLFISFEGPQKRNDFLVNKLEKDFNQDPVFSNLNKVQCIPAFSQNVVECIVEYSTGLTKNVRIESSHKHLYQIVPHIQRINDKIKVLTKLHALNIKQEYSDYEDYKSLTHTVIYEAAK